MFGIILLTVILIVYLMHYVVSKALNACLEQLATRQAISLHLEHQKWDKENGQLRDFDTLAYKFQLETQTHSKISKKWKLREALISETLVSTLSTTESLIKRGY